MRYDLVMFTAPAEAIAPTLNDLHRRFGAVVVTTVEIEQQRVEVPGSPPLYACVFLVSVPDDPAVAGVQTALLADLPESKPSR